MIKLIIGILFMLCFHFPPYIQGQIICTEESRARLDTVLRKLETTDFDQKSMNGVLVEVGTWFLSTPYVEKTLELPGDEPLVINLTGLDCTTYLETVVTFARLVKLNKFTIPDYEKELEYLRYRNGERDHYSSRLHYFSDWIDNNEAKGILENVTKSIGGEIYVNRPSFMSENPQYYPQLSNKDYVREIAEAETQIAQNTYHYIPKNAVREHEQKILPGDLIAITIDMDNLDISHVGIAVRKNGRIHLMHASSVSRRVEISEKPLSEYLMGNKSQSGIMVCRLHNH
jgi:hypothetical protein